MIHILSPEHRAFSGLSWGSYWNTSLGEEGEARSRTEVLGRGLEGGGRAGEGQACPGRVPLQSPDDAVHPWLVWGCTELMASLCGEPGDKGQRSEKTALEPSSFPAGPVGRAMTGDHIWEPVSGTSLQGLSLARRREIRRCEWVSPGADGGGEARQVPPQTHTTAGSLQPSLRSR